MWFEKSMYVFAIDGNIVITNLKVGTTQCNQIIRHKLKLNIDNERLRRLSHYTVSEVDGKLTLIPSIKKRTLTEKKLIKSTVLTFENITNKLSSGKIYILIREPRLLWLAAAREDLTHLLKRMVSEDGIKYVVGQFRNGMVGSPYYSTHRKVLSDFILKFEEKTKINIHKFYFNDLLRFSKEFYRKWNVSHHMMNDGIEVSSARYNDFCNLIIYRILNIFLNPDKCFNKTVLPHFNWAMLGKTQHYEGYLTSMWGLFQRVSKPTYIEFIDIDNTDFNLISMNQFKDSQYPKDTNHGNENSTDTDIKHRWNTIFTFVKREFGNYRWDVDFAEQFSYNSILEYNIKDNTIKKENISEISTKPYIKDDYMLHHFNYNIGIQLTQLNGNIVITCQKVASTWLIENYHKINTNVSELSYEESSQLDSKYRNLFDVELNISKGVIEFTPSRHLLSPLDTQVFNKIQKQNSNLLTNILDRNCNNRIYILYRDPEVRYLSAIIEDINTYLQNISFNDSTVIINFYLSFIKNVPKQSYKLYEKLIYDMENYGGNNWLGGLHDLNSYTVIRLDSGIDGIETLYKIIINGIMDWFFNGFDYSKLSLNIPFIETNPVNSKDTEHVPIYFRNHITQHYTPYLSPILDYYNRLGQPSYIHFLDIDTDDINDIILKTPDETNTPNKTPNELKKIWNMAFNKHLKSNRFVKGQISNHLLPDILAYNTIKKENISEISTKPYIMHRIKDNTIKKENISEISIESYIIHRIKHNYMLHLNDYNLKQTK